MALTANGSVFVWGTTEYISGEEGDYPFNLKSVPTRRAELPPIVSIASSGHTHYAMAADGTVWTWGAYSEPATDGYWPWNLHREVPVRMDRIGKALANSGSLFLKQDGMLYTTEAFPAHCQQIRLIPPPIRLVPDVADANNNAVPDAWELAQFGNTTTPMWEDSDGDGLNHIEEYQLGTNPKNANTDGDLFTDLADPRPLTADADAAPTATLVGGNNQRILPGTMAPQPLEILLTLGGQPMANMPVIARITGGTGKLAATANATVFSDPALLVRTDAHHLPGQGGNPHRHARSLSLVGHRGRLGQSCLHIHPHGIDCQSFDHPLHRWGGSLAQRRLHGDFRLVPKPGKQPILQNSQCGFVAKFGQSRQLGERPPCFHQQPN
jgi:hypothetical protein